MKTKKKKKLWRRKKKKKKTEPKQMKELTVLEKKIKSEHLWISF